MNAEYTFDPWFLAPPQEAFSVEHSEYYIKHGEKKAIRRKIFERVQYDEFERQCLVEFKEMIAQHKFVVPPNFRESSYLKMLQSGKYNMKKSFKALEQHVAWINNENMHTLDKLSAQFLQEGNVYLCGRDKQYRPVMYMDCEHLDLKKQGADHITRAMCVFLETVKKNMFIDGKVENWIFVIDTKNKGIFDLPLKALGVIIDIMQVNFGGHLEKLYILNPSFGLSTTWSVIEKMIDEEAASKIKFLKKNKLDVLQTDILPKYLQEKYSGTLPNVTQFWPPNDIYTTEEQRKEHQFKIDEAKNIKAAEQAAAELKAKNEREAAAAAELKAKQDKEAEQAAVELKAKKEKEAAIAAELKAKQDQETAANNAKQQTLIQEPVQHSKNEGLGMSNLGKIAQSSYPEDQQKQEQQHPKSNDVALTQSQQKPSEQQIINDLLFNSVTNQQGPFAAPLQESTNQMNPNTTQIAAQLIQPNKSEKNGHEENNDNQDLPNRNVIFIQAKSEVITSPSKLGFNITINKVEDVKYTYNNENQYNHEDEQKKQDNSNNNNKIPASSGGQQQPPQTAAPKPNSIETIEQVKRTIEASPGVSEAATSFKEVQQGYAVLQEEVEEGENFTADDAGQLAKKAKQNVFSKNVSTTKEDFQTVPLSEIEKPQQSGGCCGGQSSACVIF